jgi:O-antigen/teichoic acid export membrane protein
VAELTIRARQLAGASLGLGVVTVWSALLGLVTTPYLIHHLGTSAYGVFALITIISTYLLNLEFGFGHATIRFLARARAEGDAAAETAVLGNSLAVFIPGAIIAFALVFFGAGFIVRHFAHGPAALHATFVDAIRLGGPIIALSFLSSFASSSLQALGRFEVVVRTRAVFGTLASVSAVAVAAAGSGLRGVLTAQLLVGVGLSLVLFRSLSRATTTPLRPRIERESFRAMARFGLLILVAGIASQTMLQGPPTVLAGYATTAQVAAFAVPNLVLQQLTGIVGATSLGFLPFASAASADPDRRHVTAIYLANLRMTLLVLAPVASFLAVFAHPLLATWIGARFATEASDPLRLLAGAVVVLGLSAPPADLARGFGRPALVSAYTIAATGATVGLAFALVPAHGATGAALALTAGLTVVTLPFLLAVARTVLGLSAATVARRLLGPALALAGAVGFYAAGLAISDGFLSAVITGALGTALYLALAFGFVLDDRERRVLRALAAQVRGRVGGGPERQEVSVP